MNKRIVFTSINTAEFLDFTDVTPSDNSVVVKTAFSTISCGTERANITGDPNVSIKSDENSPVTFPRVSGYSSSGIIIGKGKNVHSVNIGDRVAVSKSTHSSVNVVPEHNVVKLCDEVTLQEAALFRIGTFSLAAIRKTNLEIGESMLVMGLGILGLFAVSFAKAAGAVPVIAVDPNPARREKALLNGADYALDPFCEDFTDKVKELSDGGVNTAIEVTGIGDGLNQCLDCMKEFGRIALLGCTRTKNFSVDYYHKVHGPGITIIGAHTMARPHFDSSHGLFTEKDDIISIMKLCSKKRLLLNRFVDETYSPADCAEVYNRLIFDKNFPAVVQFDWRI